MLTLWLKLMGAYQMGRGSLHHALPAGLLTSAWPAASLSLLEGCAIEADIIRRVRTGLRLRSMACIYVHASCIRGWAGASGEEHVNREALLAVNAWYLHGAATWEWDM